MREFDKWMHKHFSIQLTQDQEQVIDDFASGVGFVFQEHAGVMMIAVCILIFGLVALKVIF